MLVQACSAPAIGIGGPRCEPWLHRSPCAAVVHGGFDLRICYVPLRPLAVVDHNQHVVGQDADVVLVALFPQRQGQIRSLVVADDALTAGGPNSLSWRRHPRSAPTTGRADDQADANQTEEPVCAGGTDAALAIRGPTCFATAITAEAGTPKPQRSHTTRAQVLGAPVIENAQLTSVCPTGDHVRRDALLEDHLLRARELRGPSRLTGATALLGSLRRQSPAVRSP